MERSMIKKEIETDIARVLTEFEEGNATAEDLYDILVKIQNNWEEITGCDCH